jgi:hypothetical protein
LEVGLEIAVLDTGCLEAGALEVGLAVAEVVACPPLPPVTEIVFLSSLGVDTKTAALGFKEAETAALEESSPPPPPPPLTAATALFGDPGLAACAEEEEAGCCCGLGGWLLNSSSVHSFPLTALQHPVYLLAIRTKSSLLPFSRSMITHTFCSMAAAMTFVAG